jgi:hypothetical protein
LIPTFPSKAINSSDYTLRSQSRGWLNELSSDWNEIKESNENSTITNMPAHPDRKRITFAKSRDVLGRDAYRFVGVFELKEFKISEYNIMQRVSQSIDLSMFFNNQTLM